MNPHQKAIVKMIEKRAYRYHKWDLFRDFVECAALSVSNWIDLIQHDAREERYLQIVGRYDRETINAFPELFGELVMALECGPRDILGQVFHELEIHDRWKGQFFTPWDVSYMMGKMTLGDLTTEQLDAEEFITVQEPAAGGGSMIFGLVQAMIDAKLDFQHRMHVTAIDVDPTCVHMCYVQCALWHIPAVVIRGDTLRLEEREHWYTPAHILWFWDNKLRRRHESRQTPPQPPSQPIDPARLLVSETSPLSGRPRQLTIVF